MKEKSSKITDLLSLGVLAVFAVCALLVLLLGARVYRNLVETGGETYRARTASQYLTTRVRQAGQVEVTDFEGCDALVIREEVGSRVYLTRIYCYDGWLRELYAAESARLHPADGEKILEAEEMTLSLEAGLLRAELDGGSLVLHQRAGREAAP